MFAFSTVLDTSPLTDYAKVGGIPVQIFCGSQCQLPGTKRANRADQPPPVVQVKCPPRTQSVGKGLFLCIAVVLHWPNQPADRAMTEHAKSATAKTDITLPDDSKRNSRNRVDGVLYRDWPRRSNISKRSRARLASRPGTGGKSGLLLLPCSTLPGPRSADVRDRRGCPPAPLESWIAGDHRT